MGSHTYAGTYRIWNGNTANQFTFVSGLAENGSLAGITVALGNVPAVYTKAAIGFDDLTVPYRNAELYNAPPAAMPVGGATQISTGAVIPAQLGHHFVALIEEGALGAGSFGNGYLYGQVLG